jgi:hypothetical protein
MRKFYLFLLLPLASLTGFSQQRYRPTFRQLKEFEGLYEFVNQTTLK